MLAPALVIASCSTPTDQTVTIGEVSVVEGPPLYLEFTITGPFFEADTPDRLTIRGIPADVENLYYLDPESEYYNLESAFTYGAQDLEFYRGTQRIGTAPGGGVFSALSAACIDPASQRLRITFDMWHGEASLPARGRVFYYDTGKGLSDYRFYWAERPPDHLHCAEGDMQRWTRGERFQPCSCAGRLKGDDYVSALAAIEGASSLENPIPDADFNALLARIDGVRPYIDEDQDIALDIERYDSPKFEVVMITYDNRSDLYVDDQTIFVRRVMGSEWIRVHSAPSWRGGSLAASIHGFVNEEVLDITVYLDDAPRPEERRMRRNLGEWMRNPDRDPH